MARGRGIVSAGTKCNKGLKKVRKNLGKAGMRWVCKKK